MPLVPRLLNRIYDMNKNDIGNDKEKLKLLKEGIDAKENDRLRYYKILFLYLYQNL